MERDAGIQSRDPHRFMAQLCHQPLYIFINVVLGFWLTAVGLNKPLLAPAMRFSWCMYHEFLYRMHYEHREIWRCGTVSGDLHNDPSSIFGLC